MEIWLRSLAFSSLLLIAGKAVDPSCECLVFSSTFGRSEGRFSSPDFPKPYPRDINCILYTFIAGSQEIIELSFSDFNVGHADKECGNGDWLKVFQDLERPEVNERTPWSGILCGNTLPTLYSSGSILMLEFHSGSINTNSTGFRGTFSFVDKSKYRIEGVKTPGSTCDYQFSNTNGSSSRGRFFSPEYPSSYPKNSTCVYRFRAKQGERVRILFEDIHFQKGDLSCLDREDILKAHDGGAVQAPLVAVFCNQMSNTELISTTNQLYLEFTSSSEWPGHGFTATYHYEELKEAKGVDLSKLDIGPAVSAARSSCDVKISSDSTKKGQLFSPGFPVGYLSSTRCRYEFQGSGKERVKVVFTYFNLFTRGTVKAKECNGEDSVTPYVIIDGRPEKLESYCGNTIPKPIMSNGPRLILEFTSFNSSKGSGGFRAEYFFVKDFGITTGKQLTDYPCAFRYSSKDGLTGHFHSPNYPGLYPRDTECHYFFHRTIGHKTKIYFTFFDIEGIYPCNTGTASDYLESFNFMDNDKLHTRYCGQLDPFEIVKESRFFRITFRSNDRLDGLGFNASYRFINVPLANKKVPFNFSIAIKSVSQPLVILSFIVMILFV